jgi:hypothetical protein
VRLLRRLPVLMGLLVVTMVGVAGSASFHATTTSTVHVAVLHSTMNGHNEVNGGDPDGSGSTVVVLNSTTGQVCYVIKVANVAPITAGHIHMGPAGVAGPVVIPLPLTTGGPNTFAGCTTADKSLIQMIIDNPGNFYTNVHNAEFPGGAVRGQLMPFGATPSQ